jgi:hypothetical protein
MTAVRVPKTFGIWLPSDGPLKFGDVTISNLSDDHLQLVEHGDLWVPQSFTAEFDRIELPVLELDVSLVNGRFRCVQLCARARDDGHYVETSSLRIGIVTLVREAAALVSYLRVELEDEADVEFARRVFLASADLEANPVNVDEIRVGDYFRYPVVAPRLTGDRELHETGYVPLAVAALRAAGRGRRMGSVTDEEVASTYRVAYARNEPVIDSVANAFGWERQTAKNRIRDARRKGLLPNTVPGSRRA